MFFRGKHNSIKQGELYQDEDGATTPQAQAAFARRHRVYITVTLVLNVLGLLVNISAAILLRNGLNNISIRLQLLEIFLKVSAAVNKQIRPLNSI